MDANSYVFLSASVPDPLRAPEYAKTADTVAIASAVSALVHVVLGRRRLVWGGHPAITPMVYATAAEMGVDYGAWVTLYQSAYFEDQYPEDNARFNNVVYADTVKGDREASLQRMRSLMLSEQEIGAGIFIGGMSGIFDEAKMLSLLQPNAALIPLRSTGGAAAELSIGHLTDSEDLDTSFDYVGLLHRHLGISPRERRYRSPADQPARLEERMLPAPRGVQD